MTKFVPWAMTSSGKRFVPSDPRPEMISIFDIARQLARQCRYAGATTTAVPYSIAQHSCHVSDYLPPALKLWGLMHDAPEYILGDLIYAVKILCPDFKALEGRVMAVIVRKYGLHPLEEPPLVKFADRALAAAEKEQIMPSYHGDDWHEDGLPEPPPGLSLLPIWDSNRAEQEFLKRFFNLYRGTGDIGL